MRRWVTVEAALRCKAARPLHRIALRVREGDSASARLDRAAYGPATIDVWAIEVDALEDALGHVPCEGIARAQVELVPEAPACDMLALATGIRAWLRFEGDALQAAPPPAPTRPGGTPAAINLRRAA